MNKEIKGTVNVEFIGHNFKVVPNRTSLKRGPLKLPDGVRVCGSDHLIYFGENDDYLHTVTPDTGDYYGIYKNSGDPNHLFEAILELNSK